jgi:hypothetical protein
MGLMLQVSVLMVVLAIAVDGGHDRSGMYQHRGSPLEMRGAERAYTECLDRCNRLPSCRGVNVTAGGACKLATDEGAWQVRNLFILNFVIDPSGPLRHLLYSTQPCVPDRTVRPQCTPDHVTQMTLYHVTQFKACISIPQPDIQARYLPVPDVIGTWPQWTDY